MHQTVRFSDVFKGKRKGALGTNGLRKPISQKPRAASDYERNERYILFSTQINTYLKVLIGV